MAVYWRISWGSINSGMGPCEGPPLRVDMGLSEAVSKDLHKTVGDNLFPNTSVGCK